MHIIYEGIVWIVFTHVVLFKYVIIWKLSFETRLVHYSVGFISFRSSTLVENKYFLQSSRCKWSWTENVSLSLLVDLQYPTSMNPFVLRPVKYLWSPLWLKKYHSFSPILAFVAHVLYHNTYNIKSPSLAIIKNLRKCY